MIANPDGDNRSVIWIHCCCLLTAGSCCARKLDCNLFGTAKWSSSTSAAVVSTVLGQGTHFDMSYFKLLCECLLDFMCSIYQYQECIRFRLFLTHLIPYLPNYGWIWPNFAVAPEVRLWCLNEKSSDLLLLTNDWLMLHQPLAVLRILYGVAYRSAAWYSVIMGKMLGLHAKAACVTDKRPNWQQHCGSW